MKKIFLIHGWGGDAEGGWFNWLKKEFSRKGDKVVAFNMPNTNEPKIEEWVRCLEEKISSEDIDEDTFFVGHSVGCQTILRFLEKIHKNKKIGGCVFVAGWFDLINLEPEEMELAHPWIHNKIDFGRVLEHTANFLAIFSTNDPYVPMEEVVKFRNFLGAKIIIKENKEHFNDVLMIPEILDFIK